MDKSLSDLIGDLGAFGAGGSAKAGGNKVDPVSAFIGSLMADIGALEAGDPEHGKFIQMREPSRGGYVVTLKSGIRKIKLGRGMEHMVCASKEQTIAFLRKVLELAEAGQLDELLTQTPPRYSKY